MIGRYFWRILVSLDQLLNTILGGFPDETISSRAGKQRETSKLANGLCVILDKIDKNHCENNIEEDEGL